jgi:hypothetical protein
MRNSSESLETAALYACFDRLSIYFRVWDERSEISIVDVNLLNGEDDAHRIGAAIE